MQPKKIIGTICLLSLLFSMGCASGLTVVAPRVEEVGYGEKGVGERINVVYMLEENGGVYTLTRQPYCKETVEEIRTSRKRPRGFILALFEIPLYGLGVVDYLMAKIYASTSGEELGRVTVNSGAITPCGGVEKAAGEEVLLQFPDSQKVQHLTTDPSAILHLEEILNTKSRDLQINVFVKNENNILYIRTLDKTFNF